MYCSNGKATTPQNTNVFMDYPRPDEESLPELFELLDETVEDVERILRRHFEIREQDGHEVIVFEDAEVEDFHRTICDETDAMVAFYMKLTGLTRRVFARKYGIDGVDRIKNLSDDGVRESEKTQALAEAAHSLMPDQLYLETALYAFYKMWEVNQRRNIRRQYEDVILNRLREEGYPATKNEKLKGKPDIVIPDDGSLEVLGEVRAIDIDDFQKRAKNFRDEAEAAKRNYPGTKFVVVAEMPEHQLARRREELRETILEGQIDFVVFQDEMDELFDTLDEWDVTRERVQSELPS
ncbi:hypothetical protein ACLI4R_10730 [Natrialbaceae archaeon A-chndr2]